MNYYNDNDQNSCDWLQELMADGLIPKGHIDERSITDVSPSELRDYTQCHFFAGIGGWPLALQLAGWPEERRVWTGSCPCQPLSCAGKGKGHADERHLWPTFHRLIAECRPAIVFGEQVASKDGREWLAGVRADLEGVGYACGAADLCSASVGSPNIRQRLFWVAHTNDERWVWNRTFRKGSDDVQPRAQKAERGKRGEGVEELCDSSRLANAESIRNGDGTQQPRQSGQRKVSVGGRCVLGGRVGHSNSQQTYTTEQRQQVPCEGLSECWLSDAKLQRHAGCDSAANFWSDSIWWPCRDGKVRRIPRIESLLQCLASGLPADLDHLRPEDGFPICEKIQGRTKLLKGYGNAINPHVAAEFIKAAMECL